jgi:hypothetical protein
VSDKAGNTTTSTVSGIKIDRTAPTTAANVAAPLSSGWYAAAPSVELKGNDSLSGVAATYYSIDGGAPQTYTLPFSFNQGGVHMLNFWSVDSAGNVEDKGLPANSLTLKVDNVPPTIHGSRTTPANLAGWTSGPVEVTFDCSDAESGVATCTNQVVLSAEGANQSALGTATDSAGNTSMASVDGINIDLTSPALTGAPTHAANAAGWYNGDVLVHWSGTDTLSGIDPASQPADSLITGEGNDLTAGPVTIKDLAGNTSQPLSLGGFNIDRTPPTTLASGPTGWTNGAATVSFNATDNLSGLARTHYQVDAGDAQVGTSVSVASEGTHTIRYWSEDLAGNVETAQQYLVQIDKTLPVASAVVNCTGFEKGFCQGASAQVALSATDDQSGVRELHYAIGGTDPTVVEAAAVSVTVPLTDPAVSKLSYWAVDNAGNASDPQTVSLQGDDAAPTITATVNPQANANGWNNSTTAVHFDAQDNPGGSGVASVSGDQTLSAETPGTDVVGTAVDNVGNVAHKTVTVRIDETKPVINGAPTTKANANGWYNGPATVHFDCADALSGVDNCTADQVVTANGANQSVKGSATDKAGNAANTNVSGINIDSVKPKVTIGGVSNGAVYIRGKAPAATCSASDDLSGTDGACTVQLSGAAADGTGVVKVTASARDKAGNVSDPVSVSYYVYTFGGWEQPIVSALQSSKIGSTLPLKVQLTAHGIPVQALVAPRLSYSINGGPFIPATSAGGSNFGDAFRWDSEAQQYIYNFKSTGLAAGKLVLHVTFEDGSMTETTMTLTSK